MKLFATNRILGCAAAAFFALSSTVNAAPITFDDFNASAGHFSTAPTFSGSTVGLATSSTATRVTTSTPLEGAGHMRLTYITNNATTSIRVRQLSGSGTAGNNIAFTTSGAEDGWIGFYVKTTNTGWNVQPWLEGASNNGGTPKNIDPDGNWHLYEWNLDETGNGAADGWGSIAGIIGGSAVVSDGSHTFDSILFRNTAAEAATNVLYMDFIAKTDSGSVSNLLNTPCLQTSGVLVGGPISVATNVVNVLGVNNTATALTVYQDSGSGFVSIGTRTNGIVTGTNAVTVSGLVKGAQVVATQTINNQESCVPQNGLFVGGGASPSVRIALSIRETSSTGPIGAAGNTTSGNIHFLGATTLVGGGPADSASVTPSATWKTVTFDRGTVTNAGPTNVVGQVIDGAGYNANDTVAVRVYAYKTVPENNVLIYSRARAQSLTLTSNDVFTANWTWNSVPDAEGYRLVRTVITTGYTNGYIDLPGSDNTNYLDANSGWSADFTPASSAISPSDTQLNPSVKWNTSTGSATGTQNDLHGKWATLEAIAFSIDDVTDTGPFDLYLDNIQNGTNVFQTFENAIAGATAVTFQPPNNSGTTAANILADPMIGAVSNQAADTGNKSMHVKWQWSGTNTSKWLRLTTSNAGNPQVDLDQPISFRILMQPVGAVLPAAPAGPTITATKSGTNVVLSWTGAHNLQAASVITGTYTNAISTSTNAANPTPSPYSTNSATDAIKFFRLNN